MEVPEWPRWRERGSPAAVGRCHLKPRPCCRALNPILHQSEVPIGRIPPEHPNSPWVIQKECRKCSERCKFSKQIINRHFHQNQLKIAGFVKQNHPIQPKRSGFWTTGATKSKGHGTKSRAKTSAALAKSLRPRPRRRTSPPEGSKWHAWWRLCGKTVVPWSSLICEGLRLTKSF